MTDESQSIQQFDETGRIFVLSIAIDSYKSSQVSNLAACQRDATALRTTLCKRFDIPANRYKTLANMQATRSNILESFRNHFAQLQDGDTAVLHYSGHGSWEDTSPEFVDCGLESPGGRNEVMVVYDYGDEGILNIADKELRWLIHQLQYPHGQPAREIHFVGLMDCCFSGTIFREDQPVRIRRTELEETGARLLTDYLEGQYASMLSELKRLDIPPANFVLLSACGPSEYALENEKGGLFTQALCQTLQDMAMAEMTYADLFFHLRSAIQNASNHQQNPYFEYVGEMNPYQFFLQRSQNVLPPLPSMVRRGEDWLVNRGALHGMEWDQWQSRAFPIFSPTDRSRLVGTASLLTVSLEHSVVRPDFAEGEDKMTADYYKVGLHGRPIPFCLDLQRGHESLVTGLQAGIQKFGLEDQLQKLPNAPYRLVVVDKQMAIYHGEQLLTGIRAVPALNLAIDYICSTIGQIIRWEQFLQLRNPKRSKVDVQRIKFGLSWQDPFVSHSPGHSPTFDEYDVPNQVIIPYPEDSNYIFYQIKIENLDVYPSYFYLLHLDRKFGVHQVLERFIKPFYYEDNVVYDSKKHRKALAITDPTLAETTDIFLLLISRKALSAPYVFEQPGIGSHFGKIMESSALIEPHRISNEGSPDLPLSAWAIKRLAVKIVRV